MYEVGRSLLWFEILVVSLPIYNTYGRFTWVISINANGNYNVNPTCLNGKTDPLVFSQGLCAFIRNVLHLYQERRTGIYWQYLFSQSFYVLETNMQNLKIPTFKYYLLFAKPLQYAGCHTGEKVRLGLSPGAYCSKKIE